MTNAKVLADALVEAGMGEKRRAFDNSEDHYAPPRAVRCPADDFITDWRVAGKVLESFEADGWDSLIDLQAGCKPRIRCGRWQGEKCSTENTMGMGEHESLPRAIIEAWYEARQ